MIFTIIVAGIAGLVTASGYLSSVSALDGSQVLDGEWWRLFSGHVAHLSWRQYLVDAPAFIVLYSTWSRRTSRASAILLSLFAAMSVSLLVIIAGIHQVYGGLSGISCAAVSAILLGMIMEQPRRILPYLICCVFCWHLFFDGGFASGVRVAHEAHLAGSASGAVFLLLHRKFATISASWRKLGDGTSKKEKRYASNS